jgi:PAS domain S-box-containing protein/putative nucleotidyltransferase with HDIG domain
MTKQDAVAAKSVKPLRTDESFQGTEQDYRDLYENAPIAHFSVGANSRVRNCNRRAQELLGYSREELVGKHVLDLCMDTPEGRETARKVFQRSRDGEEIADEELQMCRANGTPLWVSLSATPIRNASGDVVASRSVVVDISEHKQIEEALRESETRYRLLAENQSDVIWTLDMSLRYTYMSPSVARMRGYTAEEITGSTVQETMTPASAEVARKTLAEELAIEQTEHKDLLRSRTLELEMCCKDGSTIWTEVRMTGIRDPHGQLVGVLGVTRDISERKQAEEELRRRHRELELFLDLSKDLTGTLDEKQILRAGLDSTLRLVAADVAAVTQILPHKPYAETRVCARGLLRQRPLKDLSAWILPAVDALLDLPLSEEENSLSVVPTREAQRGAQIPILQSFVGMPLTAHGEIVGFVCAGRQAAGDFDKPAIRALATLASYLSMALQNSASYQALAETNIQIIAALGSTLEMKDAYSQGHSIQEAKYAVALAEEMGLPSWQVQNVRLAALLHDIGKIGVDEHILNKPAKLTKAELELVKGHPVLGASIIAKIDHLKQVVPIVRHHHERFDGSGYPDGLAGEDIPLEARVLAVADVFGAMMGDRAYRKALPLADAIAELKKGMGSQFDPEVVTAFLSMLRRKGALLLPQRKRAKKEACLKRA